MKRENKYKLNTNQTTPIYPPHGRARILALGRKIKRQEVEGKINLKNNNSMLISKQLYANVIVTHNLI